uniref:uncharacterized sodium-dependent transporter YocR-like n=1 Tax=Styela clava TaxID=7725 RepID=UPI00193A396E|nr:uncharacterized sodium-dependent transporter YocR-like [Styela clava]
MAIESAAIFPTAQKPTKTFKSSFGIILTCLGSAVGTGNIWRYPRIVANNTGEKGALAFLLVWILFLFTWSIPVLLIEYGTGRFSKSASILSFKKLGGKYTMWCGAFIGFVTMCIAAYYAVICGWCLYHVFYYIANPLPETIDASKTVFNAFTNQTLWPVFLQAIVIILGGFSVFAGVRSIEPVMLAMVPVLLLLMISSFVYSLTLPNAWLGIRHLFSMDWSVFASPRTWIEAMTQNAWDTGAAGGTLLVYASYMGREHGVVRYATSIPTINNFMSLLMAITIFSTVFSVQVSVHPDYTVPTVLETFQYNGPANTGLTFIWIPILYSNLTAGRAFVVIFFFCLFIAGFSSQIAMIETAAHQLEDLKVPRKIGVPCLSVFLIFLGLGSSLNINFLVNQDYVWGSAILISGGMFVFLMMRFGVSKFREEVVNGYGDGSDWKLPKIWDFMIYVIIPLELLFLFIWWIISSVQDEKNPWYLVTGESMMGAVLQWTVTILILVAINLLYVRYAPMFLHKSRHVLQNEDDLDYYGATAQIGEVISTENASAGEINSGLELAEFGNPEPLHANQNNRKQPLMELNPTVACTPQSLHGTY